MNRRQCAITALLMTIGIWRVGARGEEVTAVPPVVTVPQNEYITPSEAGIRPFVDANVTNLLVDSDPALQTKSRDNLLAAANPGGAAAQPAFLFTYGKLLDNAFGPHLKPAAKASLRQRLNIAIVAARVSAVADNSALQSTTLTLLQDPADPVVLWALRAAQPQIAAILKVNAAGAIPPLVKAVMPAVLKHPTGPIYDEGYKALDVSDVVVVNELMTLWESRLKMYPKELPGDPAVDGRPIFTMTSANMWNLVIMNNKNMQRRVMQDISDQLSMAAQWGDKAPPGDVRDQLVQLVSLGAGGCAVVGGHQKMPSLVQAATPASKIGPATFPPGSKLTPLVNPIIVDIAKNFPNIQAPPVVAGQMPQLKPVAPAIQAAQQ
jgi:hypothetical protein